MKDTVEAKTHADVDFFWKEVVVGADIDAVRYAYENKCCLIKNRAPYHHSYEEIEDEWAQKSYELYNLGLVPFTSKITKIRIDSAENILKIFTGNRSWLVGFEVLQQYDDAFVDGSTLDRQLSHYRVVDWFDCHGLSDLNFEEITTTEKFTNKIKFFKTKRMDGDQKYLDLLCESFLTEGQLKDFNYSETMARFKITDLLKEYGVNNPKMSLWKRDVFPVYKAKGKT